MDTGLAITSFKYDNEEMWFEFVLKCTQLVSVNSMYSPGRHGMFKTPQTVRFENELKDQIILCDPVRHCPWIIPGMMFKVHFNFILKNNFWKRDTSNMVKSPEDVIFRALGINDSRVIEHHDTKSYLPGDYEYLIARISKSNFNPYYFKQ